MARWLSIALVVPACADPPASVESTDGITGVPDTEPWPAGPDFVDLGTGDTTPQRELISRPTRGGTMVVSRDETRLFVGDPDRDTLLVVDLETRAIVHRIEFEGGVEPGRIVEAADDRVHVVLRRSGEVATIDVATGEVVEIREACVAPQGIAVDTDDALLVTCTQGVIVRLVADGSRQRMQVGFDLGDIVDAGPPVRVASVRIPRVATLDATGKVTQWQVPRSLAARFGGEFVQVDDGGLAVPLREGEQMLRPNSGRRTLATIAVPGDDPGTKSRPGWLMLHQLAAERELKPEPDGYGSEECIAAQMAVVSYGAHDDDLVRSWPLGSMGPAFDLAVTRDGSRAAVVGGVSGEWAITFVGDHLEPRTVVSSCSPPQTVTLPGQPISVVFDAHERAWVQLREPSTLLAIDPDTRDVVDEVELSEVSVHDVGHDLFHRPTGSMLACVSCHPDGGDDGRVWFFETAGPRRSQSLAVRLAGSEPLHWRADFEDFTDLALEVRGVRMGGHDLTRDEAEALERWVYGLASVPVSTEDLDLDAVARGDALFQALGCAACHDGPRLTNDETVMLGERGYLQVPSLIGVVSRGPWMYDGRSETIEAAIEEMLGAGGVSGIELTAEQMADVVEYLRSVE